MATARRRRNRPRDRWLAAGRTTGAAGSRVQQGGGGAADGPVRAIHIDYPDREVSVLGLGTTWPPQVSIITRR